MRAGIRLGIDELVIPRRVRRSEESSSWLSKRELVLMSLLKIFGKEHHHGTFGTR